MVVDCGDIGSEIEQPSHACNDGRQRLDFRKQDAGLKALLAGEVTHSNTPHRTIDFYRPQVTSVLDNFDTSNRTRFEESKHVVPVIGGTVAKPEHYLLFLFFGSISPAQRSRRPVEQREKSLVKTPQAAKTRCRRDFGHRHCRVVNELFGKKNPPCLRDRDRGGAKMLEEETT
jgi:hypothetical protein